MINVNVKGKKFKDRTVLIDTYVEIKEKDFIIITGPSGVGKSSLLNIIGLLDHEYNGDYYFDGKKINYKNKNDTLYLRRKFFGYVFQDSLINENQTISRNMLCVIDFDKRNKLSIDMDNILSSVGLGNKNKSAAYLSGGEKQRLSLARALMKKPSILLADEPTASLDVDNKKIVMKILKEYNENGGTVVMVTHDLDLIEGNMIIYNLSN